MKWGVIGTAKIAVNWVIPGIKRSKNSEFYAMASRNIKKLKKLDPGCKKLYGSYDELLEDPEVKAVYIPLPNHLHCKWTVRTSW